MTLLVIQEKKNNSGPQQCYEVICRSTLTLAVQNLQLQLAYVPPVKKLVVGSQLNSLCRESAHGGWELDLLSDRRSLPDTKAFGETTMP